MNARLPVLGNVRVASPCSEPWESMRGDERVRHCDRCDLDVFNLSALTREDAEALVLSRAGAARTCIQFFQRKDGTMLTRDCPVGWRRVQRRMLLAASAVVSFLGLGGIVAFAGTRALSCHDSPVRDPLESSLVRSLVSLFKGRPPSPPIRTAGMMVYLPPPSPTSPPTGGTTSSTP